MKKIKAHNSRCQVCRHDERWRIELLRASGASLDSLAEKFGVHRDAIHRHWLHHVSPELKATYLAGPIQLEELAAKAAETGGSVLDHLQAVRVVLMGHLTALSEAGDGKGAAYIAGQLTRVLETIARISGELGDLARTTTNNFNITHNVAVLADSPAFLRVQSTLLHALAPFPDARAAVVQALTELDQENDDPAHPMKV